MARSDDNSVRVLTAKCFEQAPVWCWDDEMERHVPVAEFDPLPEDRGTLFVKAKLTAASGLQLDGFVVGLRVPYAIGLLTDDEEFVFNANLPEMTAETLEAFCLTKGIEKFELFPVYYETQLGLRGEGPMCGLFGRS